MNLNHLYTGKLPTAPRYHKMVKFSIGNIQCAVDIMNVKEIILPLKMTSFHDKDSAIVGVADHRKSAIPVIDLHKRLKLENNILSKKKWVIISTPERQAAIIVDSIQGVFKIPLNEERDLKAIDVKLDLSWVNRVFGSKWGLIFELDLNSVCPLSKDSY